MNKQQQVFMERLAVRIPRLFDAIAQGNVKSEYIVGVRDIGGRHVRLKLVAEVVDPGANPLATHGQMQATPSTRESLLRSVDMSGQRSAAHSTETHHEQPSQGAREDLGKPPVDQS